MAGEILVERVGEQSTLGEITRCIRCLSLRHVARRSDEVLLV